MNTEPVYVTFEFRGNLEDEVEKVTLGIQGLRDESAKTYQRLIADSSTAFNSMSRDNRMMTISIQENINALRDLAAIQKTLDSELEAGNITTQQYTKTKAVLAMQENNLRQTISSGMQVLNERIQSEAKAVDSVMSLQKRIQDLTTAYYNLSKAEREGTAGQGILKQIGELDKEIVQAQSRLSSYSRTAGSGFNSLSMSVQQVARELPSLTMGANMFFLAISNNLPILADNIRAARIENELLKKSGQTAVPVWKQVLSSIVSWQTALVVGITLLTVYGKDIVNWIQGLFGADRAQKRLNESMNDFNALLSKSGQEAKTLFSVLERTKAGTEGYRKAINDINTAYGKYLPNLLSEKSSLQEIEAAYQQVNKSIRENAALKAQSNAVNKVLEKAIKTQSEALTEMRGIATGKLGNSEKSDNIVNTIASLTEEFHTAGKTWEEAWQGISAKMQSETGNTKLGGSFFEELEDYVRSVYKSEKEISDIQKQFNPFFNKEQADKAVVQNKAYWEDVKKQATSVLESIDADQKKLLDSGKTGGIEPAIVAAYKNAKSEIDKATVALKAYDKKQNTQGNEINSIKAETAMRSLEIKRRQDDLKRLEVEAELDIRQARINAMEEGSRKELEQINLNYDKAYATNVRRASEMVKARQELERKIWENENPNWKKQGLEFSPATKGVDDLSVSEQARLLSYDMAAKDARKNELVKYQKDLLEKYQDYTDQRLAIEKRYNEDIAALQIERQKAEEAGEKEKVDQITRSIAKATKDKGKEMMSVDLEQLKESPEYVRAFENLKRTSSETLKSLLSQFESAKKEAARVLSPDQLREYTNTIQNIMDELDQRNPFQSLIDKKEELANAEQELAEAQAALEKARADAEAVKNGAQIQSGVRITGVDKKKGTIESEKVYLSEEAALKKVKEATDKYNKAKDEVNDKNAKVKGSEKELEEQIGALTESITEVGNAIGGTAGEIISLIGDIGTFAITAMSGIKTAASTASESISAIEKASVILMVISAAIQLATKIASFFGPKDQEQYEKMKGNYENLVKIWDKLIDRKKEYISINTGDDAVKAGQEALEILRKQEEATKKLALARLSVKNGGHSIEYRQWQGSYKFDGQNWKDIAGEIEQHTGKAFRSMRDLVEMSADDLDWIMGNYSGFWANLDDDFREYLEKLMEYKEQVAEIDQTVNEAVTQTSFDTMRENFFDALMDMDSSAEDFADNMEQYMQKAILNGMVVDKFDEQLKAWYKDWVAKSEGGLTEQEYAQLKDSYNQIVNNALDERNNLKDLFGWESEDTRSAAAKGISSMSQDSADQLNGNFNAMLIYLDKTSTGVTNINTLLIQGLDTLNRIATNTDRLEQIERSSVAMQKDIQTIINNGILMRKQ